MTTYFVTGDAINSNGFIAVLRFPTSQANWVYSVFLAALEELSVSGSWITGGETTPEEAAELFESIFFGVQVGIIDVGLIQFWAAPPSTNWLLCDGSAVSQTTYAALFAAIGTTFNTGGEPAGTFRVPDLRGRTVAMTNNGSGRLPAFANTLGGTGGESAHQLTVAELASHTHTENPHTHTENAHSHTTAPHSHGYTSAAASAAQVPVLPAPSAVPFPSITATSGVTVNPTTPTINNTTPTINNAGSDTPHNNVQPTMVLAAYILATV